MSLLDVEKLGRDQVKCKQLMGVQSSSSFASGFVITTLAGFMLLLIKWGGALVSDKKELCVPRIDNIQALAAGRSSALSTQYYCSVITVPPSVPRYPCRVDCLS